MIRSRVLRTISDDGRVPALTTRIASDGRKRQAPLTDRMVNLIEERFGIALRASSSILSGGAITVSRSFAF